MDDAEILRMAADSGLTDPDLGDWMTEYGHSEEAIKKFAELSASAERDALAACIRRQIESARYHLTDAGRRDAAERVLLDLLDDIKARGAK